MKNEKKKDGFLFRNNGKDTYQYQNKNEETDGFKLKNEKKDEFQFNLDKKNDYPNSYGKKENPSLSNANPPINIEKPISGQNPFNPFIPSKEPMKKNEEKSEPVSEFHISDPLLEKINVYLIGYKADTEAYFSALIEKFPFLKMINTNFRDIERDVNSDVMKIENPSLAITLSMDFNNRLPDYFGKSTQFLLDYTGHYYRSKVYIFKFIIYYLILEGNHIIVRLLDRSNNFNAGAGLEMCHHGINKIEISEETIFEMDWITPSQQIKKGIDLQQKNILLKKVKKMIEERIKNYRENKEIFKI